MSANRVIHWLMLSLLVLLTTGAGRHLHESIAHADGHDPAVHAALPAQPTPAEPTHHDHPECQTCVMLATLGVILETVVVALLAGKAIVFVRLLASQRRDSAPVLPCLTNRGPPVLA